VSWHIQKFCGIIFNNNKYISRFTLLYYILEIEALDTINYIFRIRVTEHKRNLRKGPNSYSVITEYALYHSHKIDWDNTEILDEERYFNKRLISEI